MGVVSIGCCNIYSHTLEGEGGTRRHVMLTEAVTLPHQFVAQVRLKRIQMGVKT